MRFLVFAADDAPLEMTFSFGKRCMSSNIVLLNKRNHISRLGKSTLKYVAYGSRRHKNIVLSELSS